MLGARYVVYIHDELISELWVDAGIISAKGCRDVHLLESAVSRPFQTVYWIIPFSDLSTGATFNRTFQTAKKLRLTLRKSKLNRLVDPL